MPSVDGVIGQIETALRVFHSAGEVFEVRIPKTHQKTVSGYFNDPLVAARAIVDAARYRANIYHTLNPLPQDLLARCANRLQPYTDITTRDHEVLRRQWLPIDADPARLAGISATEEEHVAALARRDAVVDWLSAECDWPLPVGADSGNGGHASYRIDLPNDAEATALCQRVLEALADRFNDGAVTVDLTLFNPSRVLKVYGTSARKGDDTPHRPHRRAALTTVPDPLGVVSREQLERVAALAEQGEGRRTTLTPTDDRKTSIPLINPILAAFAVRGWYLYDLGAGKHAVRCPWSDAHSGMSGVSETVVYVEGSEARWFKCQHEHCKARKLRDVRTILGMGVSAGTASPNASQPALDKSGTRLELVSVGTLLAESDADEIDWLVEDRFRVGSFNLLGGKPKAGKSTLARSLAMAVAQGGPWLSSSCRQGRVWYFAFEDHRDDLRRAFRRLGATDTDALEFYVGATTPDLLSRLRCQAETDPPALIILDTLFRLVRVKDVADYLEVMGGLEPVLALARETGSTVVALVHAKKGNARGLEAVLGSQALVGTADNIVMVDRSDDGRFVESIQRIGTDLEKSLLLFDEATGAVTLGSTKAQAEVAALIDALVETLAAVPEPLVEDEALRRVEGKLGLKRKALRAAVQAGRVVRSGGGRRADPYRYAPPVRERESQEPQGSAVSLSRFLVPPKSGERAFLIPGDADQPRLCEADSRSLVPLEKVVPITPRERESTPAGMRESPVPNTLRSACEEAGDALEDFERF